MKKAIALSLLLVSGALLAHDEAPGMTPSAGSMTALSHTAKPKNAKKMKAATKMSSAPKKEEKAMQAKKEHWVCPMHDGGESDHAGKCPKCGMDLVMANKGDGHADHDHKD